MFTVQIISHDGSPAEFALSCPVLALDLALRAARAGIPWGAALGRPATTALSLPDLRRLAQSQASREPGQADHLAEVLRAELQAVAAQLN